MRDNLSTLNSYSHTLRILKFLYEKSKAVNQTQVRDGIMVQNPQTTSNSLHVLEGLGLITVRVEMPRTNWITLTEKGRTVAELVLAISKELDE